MSDTPKKRVLIVDGLSSHRSFRAMGLTAALAHIAAHPVAMEQDYSRIERRIAAGMGEPRTATFTAKRQAEKARRKANKKGKR